MKSFTKKSINISLVSTYLLKWIFIFIAIILTTTFIRKTAHASLSSFFGSFAISEVVSAKSPDSNKKNSQTMPLPIVAVNIEPIPEKHYEIIPVVDGKTLASDLASANQLVNEYSPKISVYVVREGDTLGEVAKMYNVSVNTILWANNLNSKSNLKPGQSLVILPVSGIKYTVQKNDTVSSIAKKYNADITDIYNYNDLDKTSTLVSGQVIIIPDAEMGISAPTQIVRALNGMIVPEDPLLVNVRKLPSFDDYYSCPVSGILTQGLHGRNSVDLAAPIGTPVYASASGSITISKSNGTWNGGYGNFVVITHNNSTQTLYAHMKKAVVDTGEQVSKGQLIGYVGISGLTTGPHIHFEVRGAKNPFSSVKCN